MTKRMNRAGPVLDDYLLDKGLSPEQFGPTIGIAGRTVYRVLHNEGVSRFTMNRIARALNEDVDTIFPPMPRKRIPGGTRKVMAA